MKQSSTPTVAILLIAGTFYAGVLLAIQGAMFPVKIPLEPLRDKIEFCNLLEEEVKLSIAAGLVTADNAESIIASCFGSY